MMDKVLKFFISGNIIFNQADNPHFQILIRYHDIKERDPKVNRKSIYSRLSIITMDIKEDLMIILMENDSKISLILDYWISKNGYVFLDISPIIYIPSSFLVNILFYILYTDSDYNYNYTLD
jgi:hypothetical protein